METETAWNSNQRRRISKPLIEKRRRARINRSLSQLVEMVAKPDKVQENRTARLEKAYILEMTVEYLRKARDFDKLPEQSPFDDCQNSFQEGYRLCMAEVQNFLNKHSNKKVSEEFLNKSLQRHLCRKLKSSPSPSDTIQLHKESPLHNDIVNKKKSSTIQHTFNKDSYPKHSKSMYCSLDSCSSTSTEDEVGVSESESYSSGEGTVFYEPRCYVQNEPIIRNEVNFDPSGGTVWRPW